MYTKTSAHVNLTNGSESLSWLPEQKIVNYSDNIDSQTFVNWTDFVRFREYYMPLKFFHNIVSKFREKIPSFQVN